jgi:hypothetical protein
MTFAAFKGKTFDSDAWHQDHTGSTQWTNLSVKLFFKARFLRACTCSPIHIDVLTRI